MFIIIIIRKESCASHPGRRNSLQTLTPLLHQSVKFLGSISSGPIAHLLSVLCVWMKILSHTRAKKKAKRLLLVLLLVVFKQQHGSEGINSTGYLQVNAKRRTDQWAARNES